MAIGQKYPDLKQFVVVAWDWSTVSPVGLLAWPCPKFSEAMKLARELGARGEFVVMNRNGALTWETLFYY